MIPNSRLTSESFENLESLQPEESSTLGRFPSSSVTFSQTSTIQDESQPFTELHLGKIEKIFEDNINSTGALDKMAFIKAMRNNLSNVSDDMLEALFLKMDTDGTGLITWSNCVDYMMHEFQGKELMRKSQYHLHFHLPMKIIPMNHGCEVVKVEFLMQRFKKIGHFLTVTKDGNLQFWSESFSLISSFKLNQIQPLYNQQMWVIDMVCLHNMNLVAIASTDQKIEFFDVSNRNCTRAFTFIDLDSCPLVMDYWSDYHRGVFCFGDTKGNVIVFTSDNVANGLFNPRILPRTSKWDHWTNISTQKLLNEKSPLYKSYRLKALHRNWCQQVRFIPEMNLVASCSAISKSSLVLTVLPSKASETTRSSVLNVRKGILCFDYCAEKNFLVTGGYNPHIHLWSPHYSKKPVWLLKGHQTSVTHVLVNTKNNNILISISKDKNIRVWDLQEYVCLQSLCGRLFALGNCPITSIYLRENDNTLICSTYSVSAVQGGGGIVAAHRGTTTYSAPLCAVLYSKVFKQVVSGCVTGVVSVWEIVTGKRMMEFSVSRDQQMELTAMSLDEPERCLLTGSRDGTVKMWNYSTGESLLTFPNPDQLEISGIIHMNNVFYVTGWNKRITCYKFHKTKSVLLCNHWQTFHTEDILSVSKYQNQFLGTSSYNGDILFWNVNMLKPILKFNASQSPSPLLPKRVQRDRESLIEGQRTSNPCVEPKKWARRSSVYPLDHSTKPGSNTKLRQSLVSAPPVMRHPSTKESEEPEILKKHYSVGSIKLLKMYYERQSLLQETERTKGELQKREFQQSNASVEKIIFLQSRPRLPQTAALLSSCIDGYIYAWSIYGYGGLLGKFRVDSGGLGDVVVGAMATDENDCILVTGDSKGFIKIWDIDNYCTVTDGHSSQLSGTNKFQFLIPKLVQPNLEYNIPSDKKEVVDGQTISLAPPMLLATWKGHLDSVADILYVDSYELVISAGHDRDIKAWRLSGDAVGTFGLKVWSRLKDVQNLDDNELRKNLKKKSESIYASKKTYSGLPEEQDFAEALVYQRREEVALLALLNGKADTEAEAWAKLQKITLTSPWAGERSLKDIENTWHKWESKDKQVSKILGAAYKPKERLRSPGLLSTNVQYGLMKHQISPQIYQNLYFNELAPTHQPDFMIPKVIDQQGRLIRTVTHNVSRDLHPSKETASMHTNISLSSLFSSVSGSGFLTSRFTPPGLQSSSASQRP
ncbi:EF-hand calcium-binding domain-containing protein 8 [Myotis lucifugus]|uniref:EF-hand calcium-binding domain-containing protein 8 n=1 Tax=Myotis lucifugus TaxID=59463 RepID=UPI000CCC235A|nr:EF-hand calcium-binding domain-containing protein 8 [Myotis lucifugus]